MISIISDHWLNDNISPSTKNGSNILFYALLLKLNLKICFLSD